jgi:hypothetical protein
MMRSPLGGSVVDPDGENGPSKAYALIPELVAEGFVTIEGGEKEGKHEGDGGTRIANRG